MMCNALRDTGTNRSQFALLLREVKELAAELREVEFHHYNRSQNRVSHLLANRACVEQFSKVGLHSYSGSLLLL